MTLFSPHDQVPFQPLVVPSMYCVKRHFSLLSNQRISMDSMDKFIYYKWINIWRFPEIGGTPNHHPFWMGSFPNKNRSFLGYPPSVGTPKSKNPATAAAGDPEPESKWRSMSSLTEDVVNPVKHAPRPQTHGESTQSTKKKGWLWDCRKRHSSEVTKNISKHLVSWTCMADERRRTEDRIGSVYQPMNLACRTGMMYVSVKWIMRVINQGLPNIAKYCQQKKHVLVLSTQI